MTARVKYGTRPLTRLTKRSVSVLAMSPRTVQQRQPLFSKTTSSVALSTRRWSRPISPNSLTMTAVAAMPGCFSTWLSSVVLPLPRNPVSTVTGIREAASLNAISGLLRGAAATFPRNRGMVEADRRKIAFEQSFGETRAALRSEEHTSELQSRGHLVCRLLLEKKKNRKYAKSNTDKRA